jgi:uncharacterized membrane protein
MSSPSKREKAIVKIKTTILLTTPVMGITLCVSLFLGLMCVSLGAAFPPLMAIGGPLACGGGEFGIDSQNYSLANGERGTTRSPYCIDEQSGEKKGVTFPLVVVDTLIYGGIIFALLVIPLVTLLVIVIRRLNTSKAGA